MGSAFWPLAELRVRVDDLELRLPDEAELDELATLASTQPFDPSVPFLAGVDDDPVRRGRRTVQAFWTAQANWSPEKWSLLVGAFDAGRAVGIANLFAKNFATVREIETGSWLHPDWRGRGLGTAMRAALLVFAFDHLGAEFALSRSDVGNEAPLRVSRGLGYADDGIERSEFEGQVYAAQRLRLAAHDWRQRRASGPAVTVAGFEDCRPMFYPTS